MLYQTGLAGAYTDFSGLAKLRSEAKANSPQAVREAARQFESVFIQMALKSMRGANLESGLLDNQQTQLYRDMYDQQMALELGKKSMLGLAAMLERQLGGATNSQSKPGKGLADYRQEALPRRMRRLGDDPPLATVMLNEAKTMPARFPVNQAGSFKSPEEFVKVMWPHAQTAAAELGVDAKMLLAQAALESGWGKAVMRAADGSESHNLFGIKADRNWEGRSIATQTLEYEQGVAVRTRAAFRAYDNYADSFRDYARFLKTNPRYTDALRNADDPKRYITGLQRAGYATDPNYARKVMSIYQGTAAFEGLDVA